LKNPDIVGTTLTFKTLTYRKQNYFSRNYSHFERSEKSPAGGAGEEIPPQYSFSRFYRQPPCLRSARIGAAIQ